MAHENIKIKTPNFCLSPIEGSFCNINTQNPTTVLDVKNLGGALIASFTLSNNLVNPPMALEYVGPANSYKFIDDLEFITLEYVSSSKSLIKIWVVDTEHAQLSLKKSLLLSDTGLYHFDVNSMAVEIVRRKFTEDQDQGTNYLYIDDLEGLYEGQKLFLGPSFDPDNIGEMDVVYISNIDPIYKRITLTDVLKYQYIKEDKISFYNNIYVISNGGIGSDTTKGTLFKIEVATGNILEVTNSGIYKQIFTSRWCEEFRTIALLCKLNLLYIDPYDSYRVIKSQILNNYNPDKASVHLINDVCFNKTDMFKLSMFATFRTDDADLILDNWHPYYNFQQDTLAPYTHNITNYSSNSFTFGPYYITDLNLQVRDQFNVTLRDVPTKVTIIPGDSGALLDPLSGQVTTDINGKATLIYRAGASFNGMSELTYKSSGGSNFTGSEWVWSKGYIKSNVSFPDTADLFALLFQISSYSGIYRTIMRQLSYEYKNWNPKKFGDLEDAFVVPRTYIAARNLFSMPGGDWQPGGASPNPRDQPTVHWLPALDGYHGVNDGLHKFYQFSIWYSALEPTEDDPFPIGNPKPSAEFSARVTTVERLPSNFYTFNYKEYFVNSWEKRLVEVDGELKPVTFQPYLPYYWMYQVDESHHMTFSQLKLSLHTNWVNGVAYDELFTNVRVDQFIFVEDAVPKFWSRKNPVDTNIWIRLRPFAHNLNADTVIMEVRELCYEEDTGYIDVSNLITTEYYDAGSGLLGVEILYDPLVNFRNKAVVYVHIELYDTAPDPNKIYVDYWFVVIPDYKGPYIENLKPESGETNVHPDTSIEFDIKDVGTGVNIDTLDITVNSRLIKPQEVVKISKRYYKVKYTPPVPFRYGEEVMVKVSCADFADQPNMMRTRYPFYIDLGYGIDFIVEAPLRCSWGVPRFNDVRFLALGTGGGIESESLRIQIHNKDVTDDPNTTILPIVYRVS